MCFEEDDEFAEGDEKSVRRSKAPREKDLSDSSGSSSSDDEEEEAKEEEGFDQDDCADTEMQNATKSAVKSVRAQQQQPHQTPATVVKRNAPEEEVSSENMDGSGSESDDFEEIDVKKPVKRRRVVQCLDDDSEDD
jgi:hypothetical protein